MKIVFHIGQAKTGTTAVQKAFRRNRKKLLDQGLLYPSCYPGGINHGVLTVPILGRVQRSLVRLIGSDYNVALERSHEAWSQVAEEMCRTRPDVVLISSEFLLTARNANKISAMVQNYFGTNSNLEFLAYLRTPSQYYASAMQQKLKASHNLPAIDVIPLRNLEKFSAIGKIVVRKFARDQLHGGDIVKDACHTLGLRTDGLSLGYEKVNSSVSAEGIILLQEYRRAHHFERDNVFTEDTRELLTRIRKEEITNPNVYTKVRLKPEIAQAFDQETSFTEKLRNEYGVDLSENYGVSPVSQKKLAAFIRADQIVIYSPTLLQKMRQSVMF